MNSNRHVRTMWTFVVLVAGVAVVAVAQEYGAALFKRLGASGFIPLDDWIEVAVDWIAVTFMGFFDTIALVVNTGYAWVLSFFELFPIFYTQIGEAIIPFPLLAVFAFPLMWWLGRSLWTALFSMVALWLIASFGLWEEALMTLSLTLTSALMALALGIPIGIWAGRSDRVETVVRPVLDFMQTLPVFVWLIPTVILFGIGAAPGAIATIIFALPPAVRLTSLGIREVPHELVEAGQAFGCTSMQLLWKVQLPVARPSIMAGVNQTIMLALSMVVVAALIGAGGLGGEVIRGIQRMLVGKGFVAGISVVFIAIMFDRATRNIGHRNNRKT
jgi:glycine betaine/proline transport system permease protein